jgi:hypothetical protein
MIDSLVEINSIESLRKTLKRQKNIVDLWSSASKKDLMIYQSDKEKK